LPFEVVNFRVEEETIRFDGGRGEQVAERGARNNFRREEDEEEGEKKINYPAQKRGGFVESQLQSVAGKDGHDSRVRQSSRISARRLA
jgi:hypothetical protein